MASVSVRPKLNLSLKGGLLSDHKIAQLKSTSFERKCPIYVHKSSTNKNLSAEDIPQPVHPRRLEGIVSDQSVGKINRRSKRNLNGANAESTESKNDTKLPKRYDLDKIEETYWSQWKPNKGSVLMEFTKAMRKKPNKKSRKGSTSGEGDNMNSPNTDDDFHSKATRSEEDIESLEEKQSIKLSKIEEVEEDKSTSSQLNNGEAEDIKFLKHTDSFILNTKKQSEEKPRYQQPRCIRLYKNTTSSSSYVRGGSYPLKPCLKKESTFKGKSRRPLSGSPYSISVFNPTRNKVKLSSFSK